jgi:hypothetical protein
MPPKDYIIYIDKDTDKTVAILAWAAAGVIEDKLKDYGHKIIGKISSGSETEARNYGDQVLR